MSEAASFGPPYPHAPITEAIIELRFAEPIKASTIERASRKLAGSQYPFIEAEESKQMTIDFAKSEIAKSSVEWSGYKLSSVDRVDYTMLRTTAFLGSRLGPYLGWRQFCPRVRDDWERVRKDLGPPKITRVGVRFINRIDIPTGDEPQMDLSRFLKIDVSMPSLDIGPATNYVLQVTRKLGIDGCMVTINSGTVAPPLIGYQSVALDIDVYNETSIPANDADMWKMIDSIRTEKNRIFEAAISDDARKLFQ